MSQIVNKNLIQVLDLVRSGKVPVTSVLKACQERLEKVKVLNAFITAVPAEDKTRSDFMSKEGLHGVPFAVKDNFCTRGISTTCCSKMLMDFIPPYTATVVQKLLNAGGTLIGKANMDEFSIGVCTSLFCRSRNNSGNGSILYQRSDSTINSVFGPARNPWKYDFSKDESYEDWYIPGGSSGGSAVAVASGSCFFALGSDTGGSVRHPAAHCGIIGLKPTYGSLSRNGLIPLGNSLEVPGILAKCVDDAALIYNLISGHDAKDSTTVRTPIPSVKLKDIEDVSNLVVGIPKEYHGRYLSPETVDVWDWAAGVLSNAGATVIPVSMPHTQYAVACYHVLCCGEVASNMARFDGLEFGHRADGRYTEEMFVTSRNEGFNASVRRRITAGNYFLHTRNYEQHYEKAMKVRRLISDDFHSVFGQTASPASKSQPNVDVLLCPSILTPPLRYSEYKKESTQAWVFEHDIYLPPANLAGIPALSMPIRLSQDGLPICLQLMAPSFCETTLLRTAKFLEVESNFPALDLSFL